MKEVVDHVEGVTCLPEQPRRSPRGCGCEGDPVQTGTIASRVLAAAMPLAAPLQESEQGRRRLERAVRAYSTVIDRNPEPVEKRS